MLQFDKAVQNIIFFVLYKQAAFRMCVISELHICLGIENKKKKERSRKKRNIITVISLYLFCNFTLYANEKNTISFFATKIAFDES